MRKSLGSPSRKLELLVAFGLIGSIAYGAQSTHGADRRPERRLEERAVPRPAQAFTKLAEGSLASDRITGGTRSTGTLEVSAYGELVLYVHSSSWTCTDPAITSPIALSWRLDPSMPFSSVGAPSLSTGARLRVEGSQARIEWDPRCYGTISYVVAGVER